MGILSNIKQKAVANGQEKLEPYLLPGEEVEHIFMAKEDFGVITNKRFLFMDNKMFSSKKAVTGVPFNKISSVGMEQGGFLKMGKEVLVTVGSHTTEIETYDAKEALELYKHLSAKIV